MRSAASLEKCAEESFDCVELRYAVAVRCPAGISHPMVGLLARRLTGKYIAPEGKASGRSVWKRFMRERTTH